MIDLVFGLHLYQPPNQTPGILRKITEESYLPVINLILSRPQARFSVDIARSAIEGLEKYDEGREFLKNLRKAFNLQKVAPVNTAAYHPILPLLPEREIERQIALNEKIYRDFFDCRSQGFFPPEMAFSPKLIPILRKLGYQWTITADTPFISLHQQNPPFDWIPKQKNLAIFLRSNLWSDRISFNHIGNNFAEKFKRDLKKWFGGKRGYLIIWLDWETFGHHQKNFVQKFLTTFLDNLDSDINFCAPEELLLLYPKREIEVPCGSWSTNQQDCQHKNYWPLWKSPGDEFHKLWWELAEIVLEIKKNIASEKQLSIFDKALYSCQTWQWSCRNKRLAIKGLDYFKEILELEEAEPAKEKMSQIIQKLENLCA